MGGIHVGGIFGPDSGSSGVDTEARADLAEHETAIEDVHGVVGRVATQVNHPQAVIGATRHLGIPGAQLGITAPVAGGVTTGEIRATLFEVTAPIVVDQLYSWVSVAPAGAVNMRRCIGRVGDDRQPVGDALFEAESAIAGGFTGAVESTVPDLLLEPGLYCIGYMTDTAGWSMLCWVGGAVDIVPGVGTNTIVGRYNATGITYGAFPSPLPAWATVLATGSGQRHMGLLRWSTPA